MANELTPLAIQTGYRGVFKTGRLCEAFCPVGFYTRLNVQREIHQILAADTTPSFTYLQDLPYATEKIKVDTGLTKFLHITDVHLDLNYTVNSSVVC